MTSMEIRPWRESPFVAGHRYRVRRDFEALRGSFTADEILTYESDAWSRYDGYTGYFFSPTDGKHLRAWDLEDDEDLEVWRDLFEEVQSDEISPA